MVLVAFIDGILVANHYHNKTENVKALEAVELESIFEQYEVEEVIEVEEERFVPFTSQAPDGIWSAPWNDYAEEAVISMIIHWDRQEPISSRDQARVSMLDIAQFAESEVLDLSQVQTILSNHFSIRGDIMNDPSIESISDVLSLGAVLVVAVDGQVLDNPHYGDPAPEHHMLLIYAETENHFIANDPGTSRGEAYEFEKQKILESIQDLNDEFRVLIIQP